MATVGRGLDAQVFDLFEGLRTFDAGRATAVLAEDVVFTCPWHAGTIRGRAAVKEFLEGFLSDPVGRPSLSIMDVSGGGGVVAMKLSESGRFGRSPHVRHLRAIAVQGELHQVEIR